jgi:stress response protein SCP2
MTVISGQRSDEIMILKKGGMQLDVSLLVFSTSLPLTDRIFVRNSYPSPCDDAGAMIFFSTTRQKNGKKSLL